MKTVSSLLVSMAALACIGVVGCSADTQSEPGDDLGDVAENSEALSSGVNVPNPSGAYFANVIANGTGCPAGTWDAAISPDGKAFTVTFSAYEALLDPGQAFAIKDCALSIDLKTPSGLSFSVGQFSYQGYAILDKSGMSAQQSAKYYFQGMPVPVEKRSTMSGPYDNSYLFQDNVGIVDLVWSPCGQTRRLNALTRIVLRNNAAKTGSGYINTAAADVTVDTKLRFVFGLNWRTC